MSRGEIDSWKLEENPTWDYNNLIEIVRIDKIQGKTVQMG